MNKERRKNLREIISILNDAQEKVRYAKECLDEVQSEEQDAFDMLPEGIQESERGEQIQENADDMEEAVSDLDSMDSEIEDIIEKLDNIIER